MKRSVLMLTVLLAVVAALPVSAQSVVGEAEREAIRGVPDRWGLNLGTFWQTFDTKLRLDASDAETGAEIDGETELGLPKNATNVQVSGFYRFSDRSRLDMSYLGWDRNNTRSIERQIVWGDVTYDVGATLDSKLSGRMFNAIYKYSFLTNGRVEFGLNGGFSALWAEAKLSGEGTVSGVGTVSRTTEGKTAIFPIPVLGVHVETTLTKKLFLRADGNYFTASASGYRGRLSEFTGSVNYYFTRNVGAGAGFSSTVLKVTKNGDNGGDFEAKVGFSGVFAYLTAAF